MSNANEELVKLFGKDYHLNGLSNEYIQHQHATHKEQFQKEAELTRELMDKLLEKNRDYRSKLYGDLLCLSLRITRLIDEAGGALYYVRSE